MSTPEVHATATAQTETEYGKSVGVEALLNPAIRAISIKGPPGAGKTTLALEIIKAARGGVYISSRVTQSLLVKQHPHFKSLIEKGELVLFRPTTQKATIGPRYEEVRVGKGLSEITQKVAEVAAERSKPLIILDSWNSFARELDEEELTRTEQTLLATIENSQLKAVFVTEGLELTSIDYLVDAIVALHDNEHEDRRVRRIEWVKLRGIEIPQKRCLFTLANGQFKMLRRRTERSQEILTPQKFKPIPHSTEKYSTGSQDFDAFLGGGLRRGGVVLLEFGQTISPQIHQPLTTVIRCNFLAQGGCSVTIPSGEIPPARIRQDALPYLDKQAIGSSLRIAHFETAPEDPWFFKLSGKSLESDHEIFWQKVTEIKSNVERPCFVFMGIDTIEYTYGNQDIMREMMTAIHKIRENMDTMFVAVKQGSKIKQQLSDISDLHLRIDEIEGATILYLLKPPSTLMHLTHDLSQGYPIVKLTPIV